MHNYCKPHIIKEIFENFQFHRCNYILLSRMYCVTPTIISKNHIYIKITSNLESRQVPIHTPYPAVQTWHRYRRRGSHRHTHHAWYVTGRCSDLLRGWQATGGKWDAGRSPSDATRRVTVMTHLRYTDVPNLSLCVGVKAVTYRYRPFVTYTSSW